MKNILRITFLSLVSFFAEAQISTTISSFKYYNHKNIQKLGALSEKTLVVKEYEYSKSKLKKFKKKGILEKKLEALKTQNSKLLQIVKENWKYNKNIVSSSNFTEEDEYKKSDKHIYIETINLTETRKQKVGMVEVSHSFSYSLLRIKGNKKFLNCYSNSGGNFSDLELISALKYLQKGFKSSDSETTGKLFPDYINKNAVQLKAKTLLIPSGATKLTDEKIKEKYGFDVKIVSLSEIASKIESKSQKHAYYLPQHQAGSCGKGFNHLIYSCENQEPLVLIPANKVKFGMHGGNAPLFFEIVPVSGDVPLSKVLRGKTVEKLSDLISEI
jgi:hypothetical protein